MARLAVLSCFFLATLAYVAGHGRIVAPPQRGSLWRYPEYQWANPGHQADDQELFCGGTSVRLLQSTSSLNGKRLYFIFFMIIKVTDPYVGACGVCGDSILDPRPRKHEIGGKSKANVKQD